MFTALGFGEKDSTEPFLDGARAMAYTHGTEKITLNGKGQAVVDSVVDGKAQPTKTLDFSDEQLSFPASIKYDVTINSQAGTEQGHIDLSASLFSSEKGFHVVAMGKVIDGSCTTKQGETQCDETVSDAAGHLLLRGHSVTDLTKNPADFHRTTEFSSPANEKLGQVSQHVQFDKTTNTIAAETTVTPSQHQEIR